MVGDGINDVWHQPRRISASPSANRQSCNIAIESGDIVLIKDDLRDVVMALDLSRYAMKKIRVSLLLGFFLDNLIGIPIAAETIFPFTGFLLKSHGGRSGHGFQLGFGSEQFAFHEAVQKIDLKIRD